MNSSTRYTIIGAGLAGSLLALLLAQHGKPVQVFERRRDPRKVGYEGGRSINLALAERGLHALRQAGLEGEVMRQAVMMRGRMVHFVDGRQHLQRYGRDDSEVIWSVHRGRLNMMLLNAAERAGAVVNFDAGLTAVDWVASRIRIGDAAGTAREASFETLIGADGAGSALRDAMRHKIGLDMQFEPLGHGYKELEIPPSPNGGFRIEPNALHIWPRGGYMCIALPNSEHTFTVTLFLPNQGPHPSFETVTTVDAAQALFASDFADALTLIPTLATDWAAHPVGQLGTLRLSRWHLDDRAVLLGDAAHGMVPFHGQGMNCAFEDCTALAQHLAESTDRAVAFAAFFAERKPNADAIQTMALENYIEMRDRVDDADFLLQRELEHLLAERHPKHFVPRYAMVTFRRTPYATAQQRGSVQRELLVAATAGRKSIEEIDIEATAAQVLARLPALPG